MQEVVGPRKVIVRRKIGKRSGGWKYRLNRWLHRHRPQVAVVVAFLAACMLGLAALMFWI